jgi:mRNA-degrading endonuclease RelE of RelBE toxin-antitoxin system
VEDYLRLRVGGYRIVFAYTGRGTIQCVFAEQRSVVYELLIEALKARVLDREA